MTPSSLPMAEWLESAWLARYLDRQLAGEEEAWFEAYLLTRPALLAMVETDVRLRDAMAANPQQVWLSPAEVRAESAAVETAPQSAAGSRVPVSDASVSRPPAAHWLGRPGKLAAAAVLGLGVGVLGQRALRPAAEPGVVIATPMRVVYDTLRGASVERPMVEHAESVARYALIEVAVPSSAQRVALEMDGLESTLTPSADGFVSFLVDRRVFAKDAAATVRYEVDGRASQRRISLDLGGASAH